MKHLALALGAFGATFGVAATIGTMSLLSPAWAQEMDFMKVDANADGMVTLEEAATAGWAWTEEQFATADADGNGSLSADEFVRATDS
jgi:hypothetical protein